MRLALSLFGWVLAALALSLLIAASACGSDDNGPETTPTDAPTPTPFSLGSSIAIRGQDLNLPAGVAYINQTPDCQLEANATSEACSKDLKMLLRGDSYILFDPTVPRVISRRIEPADEADFRPLLNAIAGTASAASPGQ